MNKRQYFGTDGIRGHVGQWPITADFMLRLGRAAGKVLAAHGGDGSVLIGKDTRLSGYMFESALEAGLIAAGVHVRLLGPMPTPAVAYLTQFYKASAGIVISASHNPHHDNGIKFFSHQGEKLSDALEQQIETEIDAAFATVSPDQLGKAARMHDATSRYLNFLKSSVSPSFSLSGLRMVVDCANGANYALAPKLFSELGADLVSIAVSPNGVNINKDCGSTNPEKLMQSVLEQRADVGLAFDGDGDRLIMVDERGQLLDGDDIVYVLAKEWQQSGRLKGPVVGTSMTNLGLEQALQKQGIAFVRAQVGDRHVHQLLIDQGGILGGEASGHVLCLDRASTGDAMLCALQVLERMRERKVSLSALGGGWHRFPQKTINIRVSSGEKAISHPQVQQARCDAERELAGRGRLVLRPSGTEPVVRVTVEADEVGLLDTVLQKLAAIVTASACSD
jgi:phosphoglucosamine mutase